MLDMKLIRETPDIARAGMEKRGNEDLPRQLTKPLSSINVGVKFYRKWKRSKASATPFPKKSAG